MQENNRATRRRPTYTSGQGEYCVSLNQSPMLRDDYTLLLQKHVAKITNNSLDY
jgi:hypothetical protein